MEPWHLCLAGCFNNTKYFKNYISPWSSFCLLQNNGQCFPLPGRKPSLGSSYNISLYLQLQKIICSNCIFYLYVCTGSGCDAVNFLHSSPVALVRTHQHLVIADLCWHSINAFSFSPLCPPSVSDFRWGWAKSWERTLFGQVTQTGQSNIPYYTSSCSVTRTGVKEEAGGDFCLPRWLLLWDWLDFGLLVGAPLVTAFPSPISHEFSLLLFLFSPHFSLEDGGVGGVSEQLYGCLAAGWSQSTRTC